MQSASITGKGVIGSFILLILFISNGLAQDNSPLSRYGLGDLVPAGNLINRGMGHFSAAYADYQTVNFINPASYSNFGTQRAILDLGLDVNNRTIRNNQGAKYSSSNAYIPYLAAGFQVKPQKSKIDWGLAFGLRPLTKVSYNIESGGRIRAGDSTINSFEGKGGTYQAFVGTAIGYKNLSIGVNAGYRFGSKDYISRVIIPNDTFPDRYRTVKKTISNTFRGFITELGIRYSIKLSEDTVKKQKRYFHIGAYGSLKSTLRAVRDETLESVLVINEFGSETRVDSVSETKEIKGQIIYPSSSGFGLMYESTGKSQVTIGADFVMNNWGEYRYYKTTDNLQNAWQFNIGGQYIPDIVGRAKNYWSYVSYRAGFHYGIAPYTVAGNMNTYGITFGAGFPIRKYGYELYKGTSNIVNTSIEFGQQGNKTSLIRENYFRFTVGFSLSDVWFIKRKYD
jgi:hypothetical protein